MTESLQYLNVIHVNDDMVFGVLECAIGGLGCVMRNLQMCKLQWNVFVIIEDNNLLNMDLDNPNPI